MLAVLSHTYLQEGDELFKVIKLKQPAAESIHNSQAEARQHGITVRLQQDIQHSCGDLCVTKQHKKDSSGRSLGLCGSASALA